MSRKIVHLVPDHIANPIIKPENSPRSESLHRLKTAITIPLLKPRIIYHSRFVITGYLNYVKARHATYCT